MNHLSKEMWKGRCNSFFFPPPFPPPHSPLSSVSDVRRPSKSPRVASMWERGKSTWFGVRGCCAPGSQWLWKKGASDNLAEPHLLLGVDGMSSICCASQVSATIR